MDNFNIDQNTMNKLNSMLKGGNLQDMLSQIPPDTMKNLSNMLNSNDSTQKNSQESTNSSNFNNSNHTNSSKNGNGFDFSNIDMQTLLKMKSIMEKMNSTSDPRSNLLQSLKPYLRDEKKSKVDQYAQLLNMTNLMELFNQNSTNHKENSSDS